MAVVQVVKYNGSPDIFAWKYPSEELGTWTQLIVNESQEACLFKGGQALDLFGPGRHTLSTANIPILNHFINLPFGGRSPFTAEVWYINKVHSLDIKWGTSSPIQIQDPKYNIFIPVRASGQFGIQIIDPKAFLVKLVGTLPMFDKKNLLDYFRGLYLTKVKDAISKYLVVKKISLLEINAVINELSESLKESIMPTFAEYGISIVNFYVNDINTPEDDPAVMQLKTALAKKAEMDIIGYSYAQERSFDVLDSAASNESSGQAGMMGTGIGLGVGLGVGGSFGNQFGALADNIATKNTKTCAKCQSTIDAGQRFCSNCGHDTSISEKAMTGKCPNCGTAIADGAKFCPECGTSMINKCPKCETELVGIPKFCPDCGAQLK